MGISWFKGKCNVTATNFLCGQRAVYGDYCYYDYYAHYWHYDCYHYYYHK